MFVPPHPKVQSSKSKVQINFKCLKLNPSLSPFKKGDAYYDLLQFQVSPFFEGGLRGISVLSFV
jgi:hypothetical protein